MREAKTCEHCVHSKPDLQYKDRPAQWSYARCMNPKLREHGFAHFCSVNRQTYGLCPDGRHFETRVA